jgi:hypothetical protein
MHHNDAPNLDPHTDITDLFVFQNPQDPARSVLILNVNPEAPSRADSFDPQASYEFKIDTNGDFEAEITFHVLFAQYVATFKTFGYSETEANQLALEWLPDILPYNYLDSGGYPNGRKLTDGIVDNLVEIMTKGKMKDDLLSPHTDYLPEFPYLGIPN